MKPILLAAVLALTLQAGTVSYTGSLDPNNSNDFFLATFTLAAPGSVTIQTWSYGGGTNGAGTMIPVGGFDPVIGLYSGTGDSALYLDYNDDGSCPPGTPKGFGGSSYCYDSTLHEASLAAGTYTVSITGFGNEPYASQQPQYNTLGDGFLGLADYNDPADPSGNTSVTNNYAFDITTGDAGNPTSPVPEPSAAGCVAMGVAALVFTKVFRTMRESRRAVNYLSDARRGR